VIDPQDWRQPIIDKLSVGALPEDAAEARRLSCKAKSFVLIDMMLYKNIASSIRQRCIMLKEGRHILANVHGGTYGHHAAPRSLIAEVFRQGFYWPTSMADAEQVVRACEGCQYYA
jgi:hypothetical protein